MSVRMRHTRAHTGNRRSHHALKAPRLSQCTNCGADHLRHRACENCGTYRGRTVIDVVKRAARLTRRAEAKAKARGVEPKAEKRADTKKETTKKEDK